MLFVFRQPRSGQAIAASLGSSMADAQTEAGGLEAQKEAERFWPRTDHAFDVPEAAAGRQSSSCAPNGFARGRGAPWHWQRAQNCRWVLRRLCFRSTSVQQGFVSGRARLSFGGAALEAKGCRLTSSDAITIGSRCTNVFQANCCSHNTQFVRSSAVHAFNRKFSQEFGASGRLMALRQQEHPWPRAYWKVVTSQGDSCNAATHTT